MKPMIKLVCRADVRDVPLGKKNKHLIRCGVHMLERGEWHAMVYPDNNGYGDIADLRMNKSGKRIRQRTIYDAIRVLFEYNERQSVRVKWVDDYSVELIGPRFHGKRLRDITIEERYEDKNDNLDLCV